MPPPPPLPLPLLIDNNRLRLVKALNSGSFATVYLAHPVHQPHPNSRYTSDRYAVKCVREEDDGWREASLMRRCKGCRNVVRLVRAVAGDGGLGVRSSSVSRGRERNQVDEAMEDDTDGSVGGNWRDRKRTTRDTSRMRGSAWCGSEGDDEGDGGNWRDRSENSASEVGKGLVFLVMEYCEMDLYDAITTHHPLPPAIIQEIFSQLITSVLHVHSLGIYHRDIKPENFLVTQSGTVKLADFGLATMDPHADDLGCGSSRYLAPEYLITSEEGCEDLDACLAVKNAPPSSVSSLQLRKPRPPPYRSTPANDVWSLAVVLINLLCGRNPWYEASLTDPIYRLYAGVEGDEGCNVLRDTFGFTDDFDRVLRGALERDPRKRFTVGEFGRKVGELKRFFVGGEDEVEVAGQVPDSSLLTPSPPPPPTSTTPKPVSPQPSQQQQQKLTRPTLQISIPQPPSTPSSPIPIPIPNNISSYHPSSRPQSTTTAPITVTSSNLTGHGQHIDGTDPDPQPSQFPVHSPAQDSGFDEESDRDVGECDADVDANMRMDGNGRKNGTIRSLSSCGESPLSPEERGEVWGWRV